MYFWNNSIENGKTSCRTPDDVAQDVRAQVESVVSAKTDELDGRLSNLLSGCAKDAIVRDEPDTLKALLARIETRFMEEHTALVDEVNEQKAMTNVQTSLLEALCGEVKAASEKLDALCSHTGCLGNIEGDAAAIACNVQSVAGGTDAVSSFVSI